MADLFTAKLESDLAQTAPLADRMRPAKLDEFYGQEKIIGPKTILRQAIDNDEIFSIIFWGPPGSGKTTLARIIAQQTKSRFVQLSGVMSSKDDLLKAVKEAEEERKLHGTRTIAFVDEIHRWNKAQQDALLPYVERGMVTLIGATTENPSFEIIAPLLSRCKVFVLERLTPENLEKILLAALANNQRGYGKNHVTVEPKAMELLCTASNGDARTAMNTLEIAVKATKPVKAKRTISVSTVVEAFQRPYLLYDKKGDEHYNIISAFIKSLRGSDPDAALYWLGRMVEAGEDPLFIARRMVVFASEDVGVADSQALSLAIACMQACDLVGLPECSINLSHVAVYLATCSKSNETYVGYNNALADVKETLNQPVPLHLRNAPTKLMKELGYHHGYKYTHNYTADKATQQYLPDNLIAHQYYRPFLNPNAARAVVVIPFRKSSNGMEIWIGNKRNPKQEEYWGFVRGAVEPGETPRAAAKRELFEEAGVDVSEWELIEVDQSHRYEVNSRKVEEYYFAIDVSSDKITISHEHTAERWVKPVAAIKLVRHQQHQLVAQKLIDKLKL